MNTQRHHSHHHLFQYVVLFFLLTTTFTTFIKLTGVPQKQFQVGLIMAVTYVLWGVVHHLYDHDLKWKIVIEYLGLGFLGVSMLWVLLSFAY